MTARAPAKKQASSATLICLGALVAAVAVACGPSYFEIPIETPIRPKMDVTPFQRVLVAGFVAGGTDPPSPRRDQLLRRVGAHDSRYGGRAPARTRARSEERDVRSQRR